MDSKILAARFSPTPWVDPGTFNPTHCSFDPDSPVIPARTDYAVAAQRLSITEPHDGTVEVTVWNGSEGLTIKLEPIKALEHFTHGSALALHALSRNDSKDR